MGALSDWPWRKTLATAGAGDFVQVRRILFNAIRDHCWELGIEPGGMVECVENHSDWVLVRLADGREERVTRDYAWFISVDSA